MSNVVYIDPIYIKYRRMWIENRWKFSGDMVNLTIKKANEGLTEDEQAIIDIMNRVVEEFDNDWLAEPVHNKRKKKTPC